MTPETILTLEVTLHEYSLIAAALGTVERADRRNGDIAAADEYRALRRKLTGQVTDAA